MPQRAVVAVVDDDESVRESLPDLVREFGHDADAYSSAEDFLASERIGQTTCLVLDIAMPGMSGFDLQRALSDGGTRIPIVFITAHGDQTVFDESRERGAVACLVKPFSDDALMKALDRALNPQR